MSHILMKYHLGDDVTQFDAGQMGWLVGTLFALVLGHTFTCFLRFKGGKGVATTAGCLVALSPSIGMWAVLAWVVCMILTRYVSLSSMVAGVAMMLAAVWLFWYQDGVCSVADMMVLGLLFLVFVLVVVKHRSTIVRLCKGTEPRAFSSKK